MIFIESKAFTKAAQELLTEEEMMNLQKGLLQNPKRGVIIPGTRSLRGRLKSTKMRLTGHLKWLNC